MGYNFKINRYYTVKEGKVYPWPCGSHPDRTIELFDDDILTKGENGTFTKQTGICCLNIKIPEEDVVFHDGPLDLRML